MIFFKGAYETLDIIMDEIIKGFEKKGFSYIIVYLNDIKGGLAQIFSFTEEPVDAMITLNNLGFNMELSEGINIWDELRIPCINILMDHPFHYSRAFIHAPKEAVVLCPDRNHVNYIKRFYKNIKRVGYLPHGGIEQPNTIHKQMKQRTTEVLYTGGLSKYVAQGLIPDLSNFVEFDALKLTQSVLEDLICHPWKTTEQVIEEYLVTISYSCKEEELAKIIADLRFIDSFATSYYREQAVRRLVESKIPVKVYGLGWDQCEWADNPYLIYGGVISPIQVLLEMENAKIVLNTMTWFKDGTHDRVYNGMLAGAVSITDTSKYMKEEYESGKDLVMFELEQMQELPKRVWELLENPKQMQKIADRGYQKAGKKDTWNRRVEEIVNTYLK